MNKKNPEKKEQRKTNIQSGVSAAVGAGIGAAAGSMMSVFILDDDNEVEAPFESTSESYGSAGVVANAGNEEPARPVSPINSDEPDESDEIEIVEVSAGDNSDIFVDYASTNDAEIDYSNEIAASEIQDISQDDNLIADARGFSFSSINVGVNATDEAEILDVNSSSETTDEVEFTAIEFEGVTYNFADVDNDGIADLGAIDYNGDGVIGEDEIIDIASDEILMAEVNEVSQGISDGESYESSYEESYEDNSCMYADNSCNDDNSFYENPSEDNSFYENENSFYDTSECDLYASNDIDSNLQDYKNDADVSDFMA